MDKGNDSKKEFTKSFDNNTKNNIKEKTNTDNLIDQICNLNKDIVYNNDNNIDNKNEVIREIEDNDDLNNDILDINIKEEEEEENNNIENEETIENDFNIFSTSNKIVTNKNLSALDILNSIDPITGRMIYSFQNNDNNNIENENDDNNNVENANENIENNIENEINNNTITEKNDNKIEKNDNEDSNTIDVNDSINEKVNNSINEEEEENNHSDEENNNKMNIKNVENINNVIDNDTKNDIDNDVNNNDTDNNAIDNNNDFNNNDETNAVINVTSGITKRSSTAGKINKIKKNISSANIVTAITNMSIQDINKTVNTKMLGEPTQGISLRGVTNRVSAKTSDGRTISAAAQVKEMLDEIVTKNTMTDSILTLLQDVMNCKKEMRLTYPLLMLVNPNMAYKDQASFNGKKRYGKTTITYCGKEFYITNHIFAQNIKKIRSYLESLNLIDKKEDIDNSDDTLNKQKVIQDMINQKVNYSV